MAKDSLGTRMRAAAEAAGLKQREIGALVARRIGRVHNGGKPWPYTEAAVGQWYADKSEPELAALIEFSKLTNSDFLWLVTGVGGAGQLPREGRIVPSISLAQAVKVPIDYTSDEHIYTYFPCSERSFIITVADSRNEPRYGVGYKMTFDPDQRRPRPGQMVLAVINGEPVIGQYTEQSRTGSKMAVINPINAAWSEEVLNPKKGDRLVAIMTESAAPGP
jgi:transcriptional regulator with XRE-family HTH domain